ncbi:hypothetical protein JCM8202_003867 [Rhodotorula sphaerocarpa]
MASSAAPPTRPMHSLAHHTPAHAAFPLRPPSPPAPPPPPLLPGLSLERLGCAADDDVHQPYVGTCALARTASESLLFGGKGSAITGTPVLPFTSAFSDSNTQRGPFPPPNPIPPPPPVTRHSSLPSDLEWGLRRLSMESASDAKAKRERAAVRDGWEDPALAAARRALWNDDDDDDGGQGARAEAQPAVPQNGEDVAPSAPSVAVETISPEVSADPADAPASNLDYDGEGEDEASEEEDGPDSLLPPPACLPCHATLSPRASCLRNSPLARSASLALSCSTSSFDSSSSPHSYDSAALPTPQAVSPATTPTSGGSCRDPDPMRRHSSGRLSPSSAVSIASTSAPASVQFSLAPPLEGATHSALDYERGGDAPVEKLSVREWIELQGVREAVGVWSGRIEPWSEEAERAAAAGGGPGSERSKCLSRLMTSPTSCTAPAALVGVVQVTNKSAQNSPVQGPSPSPWR